jgi:hypothetical protein
MITSSFGLTATERVLPRLALDFTTASLDSRITFLRTGATATRVNASGLIEVVLADTPRFDFDPVTLACKGLLIEESKTNLLLQSQTFNTLWNVSGASVNSDVAISPEGVLNADKIVEDSALSAHYIRQNVSFTTGTTYTFSIYAKADERSAVLIGRDASGIGTARFNLQTLASSGTNTLSTSIETAGNGWYRLIMTYTASVTASRQIRVQLENPAGTPTYQGDGTSGAYIWGAQLEVGASTTSYIPTEASQVTRTADVATMTGTNFSDWYSLGAGGVVARVLPSTVSGTRPALQFDDATANEIITLRGNTTNPELVIVDGGAPQVQIDAGTIAANTAYNLGAAWNTDNCAAAVNGGAAVTDTSATIPTVTQALLGSDGANYLNGHLQTLRYWPQRIINAEVQAFSK